MKTIKKKTKSSNEQVEVETWEFQITLRGSGTSVEDAWEDATEAFSMEPGEPDLNRVCKEE